MAGTAEHLRGSLQEYATVRRVRDDSRRCDKDCTTLLYGIPFAAGKEADAIASPFFPYIPANPSVFYVYSCRTIRFFHASAPKHPFFPYISAKPSVFSIRPNQPIHFFRVFTRIHPLFPYISADLSISSTHLPMRRNLIGEAVFLRLTGRALRD